MSLKNCRTVSVSAKLCRTVVHLSPKMLSSPPCVGLRVTAASAKTIGVCSLLFTFWRSDRGPTIGLFFLCVCYRESVCSETEW